MINTKLKCLSLALVVLLSFGVFLPGLNYSANVNDVGKVYLSDGVLNLTDGHRLNFKTVYNETRGQYEAAYCVEHGSSLYSYQAMNAGSIGNFTSDPNKQDFIRYVLAYGYLSSDNIAETLTIDSESGRKYAATQFIIWNIVSNNYDENFNRKPGWYDYVSQNASCYSGINSYINQIEGEVKRVVALGRSGIAVFNTVNEANNNSYGKTGMLDNRNQEDVNTIAENIFAYVKALYDNLLFGSEGREAQLSYWSECMLSGTYSAKDVLFIIFDTSEANNHIATLSDSEYINLLYRVLFRRDADANGLSYYQSLINNGQSRREIIYTFLKSPEWVNYRSTLDVSSGNVYYYFEYDFPVGISPNASMIVSNSSSANVTFEQVNPSTNRWKITIDNSGSITLRLDYGYVSNPVIWNPTISNRQKVTSTPNTSRVEKYVTFNARGEITYNPTSTPTSTPTPFYTPTPTPYPITNTPASVQLVKRGEGLTNTYISEETLVIGDMVLENEVTMFGSEMINLSGAVFYARPRENVYIEVGNSEVSSRICIYNRNDDIALHENGGGVYVLSDLYPGIYDIYEGQSPNGYVGEDDVVTTIYIDEYYFEDSRTHISYLSDFESFSPNVSFVDEWVECRNDYIDVEISINKNMPQGCLTDEVYLEAITSVVFGLFTYDDIEFFENQVITADTLVGITRVDAVQNGDEINYIAGFCNAIPDGRYYVKELYCSPYVVRDDSKHEVVIDRESINTTELIIELDITNEPIEGKICVYKYDSWYGTCLEDAEFTVYDSSNNVVGIMEYNIDENQYELEVPYGNYTVVETASPIGFEINSTIYEASIVNDGDVVYINDFDCEGVANNPHTVEVQIYKVDDSNNRRYLSGAEFEIYEDTNLNGQYDEDDLIAKSLVNDVLVDVSFEVTTDSVGNPIYMTNYPLRAGRYFIIETHCPEGYSVVDPVTVVDIPLSDDVDPYLAVTISNSCYGDIHITKVDMDYPDSRLSGAEFTVYYDVDSDGQFTEGIDTYVGTMSEETDGEYYYRHLANGHYLVIETISPDGYIRRDDVWSVNVTEDGKVYDISDSNFQGIYNRREDGSIIICKTDIDYPEVYLTDSVFEVYYDANHDGVLSEDAEYLRCFGDEEICGNDYCIAVVVDDDLDGIYHLDGLRYGVYFVREIDASTYYYVDDNYYTVVVNEDNENAVVFNNENLTFGNEMRTGSLRIIKHSSDGNVEGISFRIFGTDEIGLTYDETFVTDSNGEIYIENLRVGTYVVSEVNNERVAGYILPADKQVTITFDNESVIEMTNVTPTPTPPVVKTGEDSQSGFMIGCILLASSAAAGGIYYFLSKKRK